jgi:hypothetical protein
MEETIVLERDQADIFQVISVRPAGSVRGVGI